MSSPRQSLRTSTVLLTDLTPGFAACRAAAAPGENDGCGGAGQSLKAAPFFTKRSAPLQLPSWGGGCRGAALRLSDRMHCLPVMVELHRASFG